MLELERAVEPDRGLRRFLPRGGALPSSVWDRRHRAITVILWLHVPALAALGLARGVAATHVVVEAAAVALPALVAGQPRVHQAARMLSASLGLTTASAVLVHLSGGFIEMHFHFFVMVAVVSLYQHWLPFLATIAYVALQHGIVGVLAPESVFNHPDAVANPWKWASIHAGFILAESIAVVYTWRQSEAAQRQTEKAALTLAHERRQLEERTAALALLQDVASAANQSSTVEKAIEVALAAVCAYTGWPIGHSYLVGEESSGELFDTGIWHCERSPALEEFQRASHEARLASGVGLAGRVITLRRATWVAELAGDADFTRKEAAARAGLVSAFAFPMLAGNDVAGVLEFFADSRQEMNEELLALMDQVGTQLGRVIERRRSTDSLRSSEERTRSIVETAGDAFVGMDEDGRVTDWNRRAETMFGWAAGEAVGRPVAELIVPPAYRQAHRDGLQRFLSSGTARVLGRRVELSALHRDGTEFPVDITIWVTGPPDHRRFNGFIRDISERVKNQQELEQAYESVSKSAHELERRHREVTLMGEMGELLQSCETAEETYEVVSRYGAQLFAGATGAMYVLASSRNLVEATASWGGALTDHEAVFPPTSCWALRRGRAHESSREGLACTHVPDAAVANALCIPMVAQSEAIGVLHLRRPETNDGETDGEHDARRQLGMAMAEHLALALANFRLRERLRSHSIRDPLTGLFNRRYMEESLDREIRRAIRGNRPLSVLSIDVDHFKTFNDTFGHSAGDAVLASVGRVLMEHVRGEDIPCRMGGEEFMVILPDCACDPALKRAEELRNMVRNLVVEYQGQTLGMITISIGVATLPTHGLTGEALTLAADAALYAAKEQGRDRTLAHPAA